MVYYIFTCEFKEKIKQYDNHHFLTPANPGEIKDFKNINDIIKKLETSKIKPLTFTEIERKKASELFKTVNYYSFSVYRKLLPDRQEKYSFSDCLSLYDFDCFLRERLIRFCGHIEIFVKTSFINHLCNYYDGNLEKADCYLDNRLYTNDKLYNQVLSMIENVIDKSKSKSIIHHKQNKNSKIPIWVIMEELTFGETTYFIEAFKKDIRKTWQEYFIGDSTFHNIELKENFKSCITSWIGSSRFIRNSCAHHSRIYGVLLNAHAPSYCNSDFRYLRSKGFKKDENFTLFARLLAIKNLLSFHRTEIKKEWNEFLEELVQKIEENDVIYENYLGFISGWDGYLEIYV